MHLIQLLLPRYDNNGSRQSNRLFQEVERELVAQFGGVTAYFRAPAEGKWEDSKGAVDRDEIVVCEVMSPDLDRAWWTHYRQTLQQRFRQELIVIRAMQFEAL